MNKVLVIGATNLDIIARLKNPLIPYDSNPSNISMSWGGVGHNIALNLAHLGLEVHFLTTIASDTMGSSLKQYFREANVNIDQALTTDFNSGVYFCLISPSGQMEVAAVDTKTIEALTPEAVISRQAYINSFDYLVLDANLNEETIGEIFRLAKTNIYVEATSGEKGRKFKPYLDKITMLKCNALEAESLTGVKGDCIVQAKTLLNKGVKEVIITQGSKPVTYTVLNQVKQMPVPPVDQIIEETGAGDAFMAGLIYGKVRGFAIEDSISVAIKLSQITLKQQGAVASIKMEDLF